MSPRDTSLHYPMQGDLLLSVSLAACPKATASSCTGSPSLLKSRVLGICCSLLAWFKTFWFAKKLGSFSIVAACKRCFPRFNEAAGSCMT